VRRRSRPVAALPPWSWLSASAVLTRLALVVALVAPGLLGVGCPTTGVADTCKDDDDCDRPALCLDGVCVESAGKGEG